MSRNDPKFGSPNYHRRGHIVRVGVKVKPSYKPLTALHFT